MSGLPGYAIRILNGAIEDLQAVFGAIGFEANVVLVHPHSGTALSAGISDVDALRAALDKTAADPTRFDAVSVGGADLHVWPKEQQS